MLAATINQSNEIQPHKDAHISATFTAHYCGKQTSQLHKNITILRLCCSFLTIYASILCSYSHLGLWRGSTVQRRPRRKQCCHDPAVTTAPNNITMTLQ